MKQFLFTAAGRDAILRVGEAADAPLAVLPVFEEEAEPLLAALGACGANLLAVSVTDWERDLTPWACPPLRKGGAPCAGEADAFLTALTEAVLPGACDRLGAAPRQTAIAGYSLAGLFALYALYRCDCFDRAASVSGSLWYPDFAAFCRTHAMRKKPTRLYLSLGEREPNTRHPLMRTVGDCTEALADHFSALGIPTVFEWNPGNHFTAPEARMEKALRALLAP